MKKYYLVSNQGYIRIDEQNKTFTSVLITPKSTLVNFTNNVKHVDRTISRLGFDEQTTITEETFNTKLEEAKLLLSAI